MRRLFQSSDSLKFTAIALVFMLFLKVIIIDGIGRDAPYVESPNKQTNEVRLQDNELVADNFDLSPKRARTFEDVLAGLSSLDIDKNLPQPDPNENQFMNSSDKNETLIVEKDEGLEEFVPKKMMPQQPVAHPKWDGKAKAKVAIIIDDMGMAKKYTQDVIDLPGPMTLAFLPYASGLDAFSKDAKEKGHELIIHVPMEPLKSTLDLGPAGLTVDLDKEEFLRRLNDDIFTSFDGYVGINNHMGSRLTQDEKAMHWLMPLLKEKGLYFVDSKTISTSVAAKTAHVYGVDYAERDVFLDHKENLSFVMNALEKTERLAHEKGFAIAIGHPKKNTIEGLKRWMIGMEERGLELVAASDVLTRFESNQDHKVAEVMQEITPSAGAQSTEKEIIYWKQPVATEELLHFNERTEANSNDVDVEKNKPLSFIYGFGSNPDPEQNSMQ